MVFNMHFKYGVVFLGNLKLLLKVNKFKLQICMINQSIELIKDISCWFLREFSDKNVIF